MHIFYLYNKDNNKCTTPLNGSRWMDKPIPKYSCTSIQNLYIHKKNVIKSRYLSAEYSE